MGQCILPQLSRYMLCWLVRYVSIVYQYGLAGPSAAEHSSHVGPFLRWWHFWFSSKGSQLYIHCLSGPLVRELLEASSFLFVRNAALRASHSQFFFSSRIYTSMISILGTKLWPAGCKLLLQESSTKWIHRLSHLPQRSTFWAYVHHHELAKTVEQHLVSEGSA